MQTPHPEIRLRPVVAADDTFLRALYAEVRAPELAATGWSDEQKRQFCNMQFDAQDRHYSLHYPGATFHIIERVDAAGLTAPSPLGRLYWAPLVDAQQEVLMEISLVHAARSQGIGTQLIRDLLARAARVGNSVSLHVEPDNPARRLYERLGFVVLHTSEIYDEMLWRPPAV